jgi:hypothetical protein
MADEVVLAVRGDSQCALGGVARIDHLREW